MHACGSIWHDLPLWAAYFCDAVAPFCRGAVVWAQCWWARRFGS